MAQAADELNTLTPGSSSLRLGELLLVTGQITEGQLNAALERKRETGRRIGEELVAAGLVSSDLVNRALTLQRRAVFVASMAALAPINSVLIGEAEAGQVRAYMNVTATVVDSVSIRAVYQAQNLVVTPQDIERGYVEVPAASRLEIKNTRPSLFEFRPVANIFRSFKVTGREGAAAFGSAGGTMLQKSSGDAAAVVDMSYRFELAAGVSPVTYAWPLSLTVLPL